MAKDSSFDVVSQVDMQEMDNAVNQTKKEIAQRYDFRGSDASIELEEKCIKLAAEDEYKLNAIIDMLRVRMAKRDIPLRCLELGKVEPASKGTVRQTLTILQGIPKEKAKAIVAAIKATKLKVNAQMQDDQVRVSGAKKDDLQAVIQTLKAGDFGVDLQFINMR
ncbi:YajQ family cyclic di-GMP-binding protein [Phascolarctobacterium sp.]|uniref:YajQ family cyclic di-GMP-binding protein n=1 Tax=Phascolarctobacterium sp. TaxID=2049039 RepID=UPI00257954FB|nr:YajQ family cyclic di-GMP-binding protein [Phascolarctobacterium sp.]MBS6904290.1 YajQ family cyclic di-GMP-binding protein [Phascolarctobacterium sp.]